MIVSLALIILMLKEIFSQQFLFKFKLNMAIKTNSPGLSPKNLQVVGIEINMTSLRVHRMARSREVLIKI
jgi:hypothetical protein